MAKATKKGKKGGSKKGGSKKRKPARRQYGGGQFFPAPFGDAGVENIEGFGSLQDFMSGESLKSIGIASGVALLTGAVWAAILKYLPDLGKVNFLKALLPGLVGDGAGLLLIEKYPDVAKALAASGSSLTGGLLAADLVFNQALTHQAAPALPPAAGGSGEPNKGLFDLPEEDDLFGAIAEAEDDDVFQSLADAADDEAGFGAMNTASERQELEGAAVITEQPNLQDIGDELDLDA